MRRTACIWRKNLTRKWRTEVLRTEKLRKNIFLHPSLGQFWDHLRRHYSSLPWPTGIRKLGWQKQLGVMFLFLFCFFSSSFSWKRQTRSWEHVSWCQLTDENWESGRMRLELFIFDTIRSRRRFSKNTSCKEM